jgi:hypothetical protein
MTETLPPMTGAELKCTREYLGLSTSWLAEHLACDERRLQRMELDQEEINNAIASAVDDLYEETADTVRRLTDKYRAMREHRGVDAVEFPVYRNDSEYYRAHKHARFPVRWHRQVAARVADRLPGLVLSYSEPYRVNKPPWKRENEDAGKAS